MFKKLKGSFLLLIDKVRGKPVSLHITFRKAK